MRNSGIVGGKFLERTLAGLNVLDSGFQFQSHGLRRRTRGVRFSVLGFIRVPFSGLTA